MSIFRDVEDMRSRGYDPSSIDDARTWNAKWEQFLASPLGEHLRCGDDEELWNHPEGPFLSMESIARGVEELVPNYYLFRFGLIPVWSSVGGHVIAYHPETKTFYWADHSRINNDEYVELPETYQELPFNSENLMRALIVFSTQDCGIFLNELRDGVYDERIDELD